MNAPPLPPPPRPAPVPSSTFEALPEPAHALIAAVLPNGDEWMPQADGSSSRAR